ncbi:unnamed protein product [Rhizoctonia solani]|uniref:Uncharacterized protein n=1 Tax=Rhizoctonia solani TaxID=456999 RepID=A0A8H2X079_9AGAM|nr:unnamed protein product [Rhizoctonia solani]
MGEIYLSQYTSDSNLEPGTYRVFNVRTATAIQISDHDPTRIVTWERHDGKNQQVHIWHTGEEPHKIWGLERLGDNSGEEIPSALLAVRKDDFDAKMELVNKELAERQERIAKKDRELLQLQDELSSAKGKFSELHNLLYKRDETIHQLQQDLKSKGDALSHAHKMNEESANLRNQHNPMESKLSQQQAETATLQSKMDRVEYFMSQVDNG